MSATAVSAPGAASQDSWRKKLNSSYHEICLRIFAVIVLAHWAEHLAQAFQIYALGRHPPQARGVLGQFFPWLIKSESLHYGYAILMLVGLIVFRGGFTGKRDRLWWTMALVIQFWHHIEHFLLLGQSILHANLFGRPVPTSILQLFVPRVELHLFYNTVVFIPMAIGMYYHLFPENDHPHQAACTCAQRPRRSVVAA